MVLQIVLICDMIWQDQVTKVPRNSMGQAPQSKSLLSILLAIGTLVMEI